MRRLKALLFAGLLVTGLGAGGFVLTAPPVQATPSSSFCTNTGCDHPGQSSCPYLDGGNCQNSEEGCLGWVACRPE